jgi:YD repeat-containing protein
MGRKIAMLDPDMGNWQYQYDVLGELVTQVDAKNQTVTLGYDVLGRVLTRSEPDLISSWTYDTAANGKGKLASTTSNNGYSRTFTYDGFGRVKSISSIIDNPASPYVETTAYDAYGRVLQQTEVPSVVRLPRGGRHATSFCC